MSFENPSKQQIKNLLDQSKTIAVVGLSDKPHRTSYQVSEAMQKAGYKIIPINPTIAESLGEKAIPSLSDLKEPVDIINVFRRSENLPDIAKEALKVDAKAFWAQQGVYSEEASHLLKDSPKLVIMDLCIKVAQAIYQ
ncbi:Predicted CoA-binding protein [Halobacillus karajensis]|uniref:Acetyl coenzyme A synthetase (ADP forming), alpha domain n=1 Tax=Halobacillus karajensis TaxID=195088 RepID=A0A024P1P5_9BACI|nr:CoA-binding protein [Halobacillus karajensis]CDQ19615.1 acetyl coenzyme A synthetase (ADP forming), alpha domain [Halobacillus karajensis]CDQ22075.1 acetyl coenzyme A synthetase (ADP forming), alpha domain [Halobacillus karajensis]CDQ27916.1 acetyl coenzyme A synthetase (ADP forming), alpha domain [Halobacillus karajensis]SEH79490.1 Predicted CoA-binding protein [Halobacillus karajensis]